MSVVVFVCFMFQSTPWGPSDTQKTNVRGRRWESFYPFWSLNPAGILLQLHAYLENKHNSCDNILWLSQKAFLFSSGQWFFCSVLYFVQLCTGIASDMCILAYFTATFGFKCHMCMHERQCHTWSSKIVFCQCTYVMFTPCLIGLVTFQSRGGANSKAITGIRSIQILAWLLNLVLDLFECRSVLTSSPFTKL